MKHEAVSFTVASIIGGTILAMVNIYLLEDFDPKYKDDLGMALQLDVLSVIIVSIIALISFLLGKLLQKRIISTLRIGLKTTSTLGFLYFCGINIMVKVIELFVSPESIIMVISIWLFIIGYPLVVGYLSKNVLNRCASEEITE